MHQTLTKQDLIDQLDRRDTIIFTLMKEIDTKNKLIHRLKRIWWVKIHLFLSRTLP